MTIANDEGYFAPAHSSSSRTAVVLSSLMQMWEDAANEEEESETELMVMLSGMVGSHATSLDDA